MTTGICGITNQTLGVWVDDAPSRVTSRRYFDALAACNFDLIDVMVDTARPGWDPKWSPKRMEKLGELALEYEMEVALTVWPDPVPSHLEALADGVVDYAEMVQAVEVCSDLEAQWHRRRVRGFPTLDRAGDRLVQVFDHWRDQCGVRCSVSTFTAHNENGAGADVAPHADLLLAQAYSVRSRNRRNPETGRYDLEWKVPWDHTYGPGNMVKHTLDRTEEVPGVQEGDIEIGCGLAAYDQKWPRRRAQEAMARSLDAATGYGAGQIRYWSSKWIVGKYAKRYAQRFLQSLR